MARPKKAGDTSYNARRRFKRQAERYIKKAESAIGAAKLRFYSLASNVLEQAISLYESPDKIGTTMRNLAEKLNIDVKNVKQTQSKLETISQSYEALVNQPEKTGLQSQRDREAKSILSKGNIRNRFYAGLIDVWEGLPPNERDAAILEHFNADSLLDVIEELEQAGIDLYSADENVERYEAVALSIARYNAHKG